MRKNKYEELLEFLQYHIKNNPKRTLIDILPLLNELLRQMDTSQIKQEKGVKK